MAVLVGDGAEAPVVEDEDVHPSESSEERRVGAVGVREREFGKQAREATVDHAMALATRLLAERAGDARLAHASGAGDEDVAVFGESRPAAAARCGSRPDPGSGPGRAAGDLRAVERVAPGRRRSAPSSASQVRPSAMRPAHHRRDRAGTDPQTPRPSRGGCGANTTSAAESLECVAWKPASLPSPSSVEPLSTKLAMVKRNAPAALQDGT